MNPPIGRSSARPGGAGPTTTLRPEPRATYTVAEVADLLGLSLGGTYTLTRNGKIPALRMGGRWLIPKRRFHAWLDAQPEVAPSTANEPAEGSTRP